MTTIGAACFQRAGLSLDDIRRCAYLASNLSGNENVRKVFVWWSAHLMDKHSNDREVMDAIRQGSTPRAWSWFMKHLGRSSNYPWNRMMEYLQKCGCSLAEFFLRYLKTISSEEAIRRQQAAQTLSRAPASIPRRITSTGFTAFARTPTSTARMVSTIPIAATSGFSSFTRIRTTTGFVPFVRVPRPTTGVVRPLSERCVEGLGRIAVGHPVADEPAAINTAPALSVPDVAVRSVFAPAVSIPDIAVRSVVAPAMSIPDVAVEDVEESVQERCDEREVRETLGKRVRKSWPEMTRPEKARRLLDTLVFKGKVQCTDEGYSHYRMVVRGGRNGTRLLTEDEEMLMNVDGLRKDERNALKALVSF